MGMAAIEKSWDIDRGVAHWRASPGSLLLDVRTPQEYRQGHIPGSQNVPLQRLDKVSDVVDNEDTALYVYCQSGARSRQAVNLLRYLGYTRVINIGGIADYSGKVER